MQKYSEKLNIENTELVSTNAFQTCSLLINVFDSNWKAIAPDNATMFVDFEFENEIAIRDDCCQLRVKMVRHLCPALLQVKQQGTAC